MLTTVSHELRTPLAAVYGAAKTLEAGRFDDATRAMLVETIAQGCERLRDRIEQIHVASVVKEQSLLFPGAEAELTSIVRDVAAEFEQVLPPQFELQLRVPSEPVEVPRDPDRIRRVLVNLLENAIAYSPDGGPIEIQVTQSDEGPCIEVADRGIGIPPAAADPDLRQVLSTRRRDGTRHGRHRPLRQPRARHFDGRTDLGAPAAGWWHRRRIDAAAEAVATA